MARRTPEEGPGSEHRQTSSTEEMAARGTASTAAPSKGKASKAGAASMAAPKGGAAGMAHVPVSEQYERHHDDTSPGGRKPSRHRPSYTNDSTHTTRPVGDQHGGSAASGPSKPWSSERHHTTASFYDDAAEARKARLRREARSMSEDTPKTSAAERVRKILGSSPRPDHQRRTPRTPANQDGKGPRVEAATTTKGAERNSKRLREADAADQATLGESSSPTCLFEAGPLPGEASLFFPDPIVGPCDEFDPPPWFLEAIKEIFGKSSPTPTKSPIRFELSDQAAEHNATLLRNVDFDVGRLIQDHGSSTLGFGSEFCQVSELQPLLGRHPHFPQLAKLLTEGMHYVFERELTLGERAAEMSAMLARGNHKSAQQEQAQVGRLLAKDVIHGFTIPLPIASVPQIPGAMVQPLGLVKQWTVDSEGARQIKYRLTQDLSFSTDRSAQPTSINSRVDMSAYVEMVYGWCLPRIIHFIVSLRSQNPETLILTSKYDYSDAYRRIAHSADAATQTIAVNGTTAYLSLRLTFGGSPNPPTWCMFSELVTDLSNEIGQCHDWDPTEIRSPDQPVTPESRRLPAAVPIAAPVAWP